MDTWPALQWVLSTLLPIALAVAGAWIAMRIKLAEVLRDVEYIKQSVKYIEGTLPSKADKEVIAEIKVSIHDMNCELKEIKEMLTQFMIDSAAAGGVKAVVRTAKKNSTNT
jgi:hypothetical protein